MVLHLIVVIEFGIYVLTSLCMILVLVGLVRIRGIHF